MSLSDYDGLKQEIIDWSHREDIDQRVDTFIQMAENVMYNNPAENLKVRGQEATIVLPTAGQVLALPSDYMEIRAIQFLIPNNNADVLFRSPSQMKRRNGQGKPDYFTITDNIEFNRIPDSVYTVEIKYHSKPQPLSTDNQTNEALLANPNIYLFGALSALFQYAQDEQQAAQNFQQFMNEIKGTNKTMKRGRFGPAPQMTLAGSTP